MTAESPAGACPPKWILWLWPLLDRLLSRIIGIRPMNPHGGLMGISYGRHRGRPRVLKDGTALRPGSRLVEIHVLNRRLASLTRKDASRGLTAWDIADHMSRDLAVLARQLKADTGIEALHGTTLLVGGIRRLGFSIEDGPPGLRWSLTSYYLRGLMRAYYTGGAQVTDQKVRALVAKEAWMSRRELLARYGGNPPDDAAA